VNAQQMIDAFAAAKETPLEAIQWARANWSEAGPALLDLFEAYVAGSDRSDRATDALFAAVLLFSEKQETRAFPLLCRLSSDHDACEDALGDAITESVEKIAPRIWGGDLGALQAAIEDEPSDPYMRGAFLRAFCWLALTGAIEAADARSYLMTLPDRLKPQTEEFVWWCWSEAAYSVLGEDAEPAIRRAYEQKLIDPTISGLDEFEEDRRDMRSDPEGVRRDRIAEGLPIDDAVVELGNWDRRWDEYPDEDLREEYLDRDMLAPTVNPYRDVGRNDPCPCGSGKKFKKCCLPKTQQEGTPA
jgi:uncharacterized protein